MAPKRKRGGASPATNSSAGPEPALGRSSVLNLEGLDKTRHASGRRQRAGPPPGLQLIFEATNIPLHLHALFSGLLPPFSDFFNVVLMHYQVHALHLDPGSIVLLLAFAFLCEAFVGIAPSVALLRQFFSLQLVEASNARGACHFRRWRQPYAPALTPCSTRMCGGSIGSGCT